MKAYVEVYGCTLNVGESREAKDLLAGHGWDLVDSPEGADLAVLVTCVVIEKTEREMLKRIKSLRNARKLVITGCMATACRERAKEIVPDATFVPPGDLASLSAALSLEGVGKGAPAYSHGYSYSIVPIATGCLGRCAYCITQIARGKLRSRPIESIVRGVEEAVARGPIEVQLTAQDTAVYGLDMGSSLPELVDRVCAIPGDFRVRVGMMNPKSALQLVDDLPDLYGRQKVFKFLHLPVQSGSDAVLQRMNRGYSVNEFETIVSRLRTAVPELTLSSDLIVGFPGETEEDHAANLRLISRVEPDIVNVTRYSERPGTAACGAPDKVVGWKVKNRSRELARLRFSIALAKNREWIGRTVRVLATEPGKPGTTIFRTDEYRQVVIHGTLSLGGWSTARVTGATATYLTGVLEGPG